MRTLISSFTLLAVSIQAFAGYSPEQAACQTWTDLRRSDRALPEMSWVQGFMESAFLNQPVLAHHKNDYSDSLVFPWVDKYCLGNPLKHLNDAVTGLEAELISQYSQPKKP